MTQIIEMWQETVARNDGLLAKLSPEDWVRIVNFYGRQIPLVQACWFELFDHIHHRGQFSVYLRLAGARVPSIYGPYRRRTNGCCPIADAGDDQSEGDD